MACTVGQRLQERLANAPVALAIHFLFEPYFSMSRDRGINSLSLNQRGSRAHLPQA
jgi:hypothetical protein